MAEFCLKCFNELNDTSFQADEIWLEEGFCEGCAGWRPCVVDLRVKPIIWRLIDWAYSLFHQKGSAQLRAAGMKDREDDERS